MLLYIIRHGETDWNRQRKIQGAADISLNENGIALAEITAEALKDVPFDAAISSPLKRALETAQILLRGREIPIELEPRIQEINLGELEGAVMKKTDPFNPLYDFFHNPEHFVPARGGETIEAVCKRTGEFYEELIHREDLQDKTVLIATHGCAVRGILHSIYEDATDYWHGGVCPNCGVNIVEVKDGKSTIVAEDRIYY